MFGKSLKKKFFKMEKIVGTRQYGKNCWNQATWKKKGDPGNMKKIERSRQYEKNRKIHGKFWFSPFFSEIKLKEPYHSPCFIHISGPKSLGEPGVGCGSFIFLTEKIVGTGKGLSLAPWNFYRSPRRSA